MKYLPGRALMNFLAGLKNKYLSKESFFSQVLTLTTGTTIAQIIPIAVTPILTRIYKPDEFGIFALYLAVASMVTIIATGRYELAIMLPKEEKDAVNLLALSIVIAFFLSLLIFLALLIVMPFRARIAGLIGKGELSKWFLLISVSMLLTGVNQSFNYWYNRKKQYKRLSIARVLNSGTGALVSLTLGAAGFGAVGLIFGKLSGDGCSLGVLSWNFWREEKEKIKLISKKLILENSKKYQDFPKVNSLHAFMDALNNNGVAFLISAFFGVTALGFYAFSMRVLNTPMVFIGGAVSQVFFQKATETYNRGGDLQGLLKKIIIRLAIIRPSSHLAFRNVWSSSVCLYFW